MFDLYYDQVLWESMNQNERDKTGSLLPAKSEMIRCRCVDAPENLIINRDSESLSVRFAYHTKVQVRPNDRINGRVVLQTSEVRDVFGSFCFYIVYTE